MRKPLLFFFALFVAQIDVLKAQVHPTDTVPAKINYQRDGDVVAFSSELRPLRPIAGAPEPFYTYFWEFGDGGFSFEKEPKHIYLNKGTFHPRLYATNNYDDGKPPPRRPGSIQIKQAPAPQRMANTHNFFKDGEHISLKSNNMPKPDEEMVLILGYKHNPMLGSLSGKGSIVLFFNDKEFKNDNFKIDSVRSHHQEKKSSIDNLMQFATSYFPSQQYYAHSGPSTDQNPFSNLKSKAELIKERIAKFRSIESWTYDKLNQNEENFMFFSMKTTPEMLKDTNAVVNISAMLIPDNPLADVSVFDLELQIVASHDPNKMMLRSRSMNYRFVGKNRLLTYKVKFQNTGKGPASMVNIGVKIPENLDKSSIKIIKTDPEVPLKDARYTSGSVMDTLIGKDSVNFIFKNIYLAGMQQDGVSDADSTKGFVEYSIKFKEKPKKTPFASGAAIIFDKNEPIYTNKARGKFKTGISPGIVTGYGFLGSKKTLNEYGDKNFSLGFTVSPFSPYRKFLQAEIYVSHYNYSNEFVSATDGFKVRDTVFNGRDGFLITGREFYSQSSRLNIDLVPIQLRYNINSFIGVGMGAITSLTLNQRVKNIQRSLLEGRQAQGEISRFTDDILLSDRKKSFSEVNAAGFLDVQLGLVRKGPALGFRYIKSFSVSDQRFFTYLSWKI